MRRKLIILAAFGLAGAGAILYSVFGGQDTVEGFTLVKQPYVQTIQGTGRIQADRKTEIKAQVNEVLKEIRVKEGQMVQAGEILARFEDHNQVLALKETQLLVDSASNRLDSVGGNALEAAESLMRQQQLRQMDQEIRLERSLSLFEAGQLSLAELEALKLQKALIDEEVQAAQRAVEAKKPGGHEYREAQTVVAQAKVQLERRQIDGGNYEIKAPFSGVVLKVEGTEGKQASIGEILLSLADPSTFRLRMEIDERYLGSLREGQKAFFWLGQETERRYSGAVETVARQVDPQTGTIEVSVRMDETVPWLVEDLTLQAEIVLQESSQGLLIPQSYLYQENPFQVLVLREGLVEVIRIEGLRIDRQQLLVLQGLSEGMQLLDPNQEIKIGQKVSPSQVKGGPDYVL